jgi:hypothetical protein
MDWRGSLSVYWHRVVKVWYALAIGGVMGLLGALALVQESPLKAIPAWMFFALMALALYVAQFIAFHQHRVEAMRADSWSPYDFYRDRVNDAIDIKRRNEFTWGDKVDLAIDFGRLVGGTLATLRGRGLNREADSLFPFGNPLHVSDRAAYDRVNDLPANIRMRAEELEGRLKILRDRQAMPTT